MSVTPSYDSSFPDFSLSGYKAELIKVTTSANETTATITAQIIGDVKYVVGYAKWTASGRTISLSSIPAASGVYDFLVVGY